MKIPNVACARQELRSRDAHQEVVGRTPLRKWELQVSMRAQHQQLFSVSIPDGWEFYPDDLGGSLITPCRTAVLHIHSEGVTDVAELPNLTRMLAGFLTLHHKPVATDELLPIKLPGALCFAYQYAELERVVRVWIIGNEKAWAFLNFQVPMERVLEYRAPVDALVRDFQISLEAS